MDARKCKWDERELLKWKMIFVDNFREDENFKIVEGLSGILFYKNQDFQFFELWKNKKQPIQKSQTLWDESFFAIQS